MLLRQRERSRGGEPGSSRGPAKSCSRPGWPPPCGRTTSGSRRAGPASVPCGWGEAEVQHLPVVPRHLNRLGHGAEHLAGHPLDHRAVDAGQLGLQNPGTDASCGHLPSACRHRPGIGCDRPTDFLVAVAEQSWARIRADLVRAASRADLRCLAGSRPLCRWAPSAADSRRPGPTDECRREHRYRVRPDSRS